MRKFHLRNIGARFVISVVQTKPLFTQPTEYEYDVEDCLFLSEFTTRGLASWLFLIFIRIKVVSTVIGLIQVKREALLPIVWWVSKFSALAVAINAFALASFAGDRVAQ